MLLQTAGWKDDLLAAFGVGRRDTEQLQADRRGQILEMLPSKCPKSGCGLGWGEGHIKKQEWNEDKEFSVLC